MDPPFMRLDAVTASGPTIGFSKNAEPDRAASSSLQNTYMVVIYSRCQQLQFTKYLHGSYRSIVDVSNMNYMMVVRNGEGDVSNIVGGNTIMYIVEISKCQLQMLVAEISRYQLQMLVIEISRCQLQMLVDISCRCQLQKLVDISCRCQLQKLVDASCRCQLQKLVDASYRNQQILVVDASYRNQQMLVVDVSRG